jgi:hypothetical protein
MLLDLLIVAGLVAAVLPTPTNVQYALPALPVLFTRLGLAPPTEGRSRFERLTAVVMGAGLVLSIGYAVASASIARLHRDDWPSFVVTREAHWIGEQLRAARASGAVASLRPEEVLDTGYRLDPRFATGPFVFRTAQNLSADELARLKVVGPQTLGAALDQAPPAGIVVGAVPRLDPLMRQAALARSYRREVGPDWHFELYVRPGATASSQTRGR